MAAEPQRLTRPAAGQSLALPIGPDARLEFAFDQSTADLSKDGQNLVFDFGDGAQLVLEGFYDNFGDGAQPPVMVVEGAELPGEQFLAALNNPDLMPAAGPAAAAPLGGGSYEDATLAGILGVDYLEKLTFDGWGGGAEPTELYLATPETPGGSFELSANSYDMNGSIVAAALFEDWRPNQHDGDYTVQLPGKLDLTFTTTGTTVVDEIRISGFDAGTVIVIGQPSFDDEGNLTNGITISGPDQILDFTRANFENDGVYVLPPPNSDHDMNVDIEVDLRATSSGARATITDEAVIVVDAVADKPVADDTTTGYGADQQDHADPSHGQTAEAKDVSFAVKASFGDVLDGSEAHYIDISGIPADWEPSGALPDGWTIVETRDNGDGTHTLRIDVSAAATANAEANGTRSGSVEAELHFDPKDWTSGGLTDADGNEYGRDSNGGVNTSGPAEIIINAVAVDAAQDAELRDSNNESVTELGRVTVELKEDTPTVTEKVTLSTDEQGGQQGNTEALFASLSAGTQTLITGALDASGYDVPWDLKVQGAEPSDVLGANTTTIDYDLRSDGRTDGDSGGSQGGKTGFSVDSLPEIMAKLPGDADYTTVTYDITTDPNTGNICIIGHFGNTVAVVITVEPESLDGGQSTARISVVQFTAFEHAPGEQENSKDFEIKLKLTDDDGDAKDVTVTYTAKDDVPTSAADAGSFDEKQLSDGNASNDIASGNVLVNDVSGSDGWMMEKEGEAAVIEGAKVSIELPGGGTFDLGSLTVGEGFEVTVPGAKGADGKPVMVPAGTLTLNADGSWTFEPTRDDVIRNSQNDYTGYDGYTGEGIIRDFDLKVNYTAKDADSDPTSNTLTVNVKAAPIGVSIEGSISVRESKGSDSTNTGEAAGVAEYTLSLRDWDNSPVRGAELYEAVTITLQLDAGTEDVTGKAELADFNLNPDAVTVTGMDGKPVVGLKCDVTEDGRITITVPEGYPTDLIKLNLPLVDDAYGGYNSSSDHDEKYEDFSLKLVSVTGPDGDKEGHYLQPDSNFYNKPGIYANFNSSNTFIIDDSVDHGAYLTNRIDGDHGYSHILKPPYTTEDAEHHAPLDGPVFRLADVPESITEGSAARYVLKALDPNLSNDLTYSFTDKLVEKVTLELEVKFQDEGGVNDFKLTSLTSDGAKVVIGQTDANGVTKVTVTLEPGFDMSQIGKVGIKVQASQDNLENEAGEGFSVAITSAVGNECTYYGEEKTTTIDDVPHKNELLLSGTDYTLEGGALEFLLTLRTDTRISDDRVNTDEVTATLRFSGAAEMGKDYFIDKIREANEDKNLNFGEPQPDGADGWLVEVTIPSGSWTIGTAASGGFYDNTLTLKVPTKDDSQVAEVRENLTVTLVENSASGAEITTSGGTATGVIDDESFLNITGTKEIWEDPATDKTLASYTITMEEAHLVDSKFVRSDVDATPGKVAAQAFTFDIVLKNGTALFDPNMTDNKFEDGSIRHLDGSKGSADYGWSIPDPKSTDGSDLKYDLSTPEGRADFVKAYNDYLASNDIGITGISVSGVKEDGTVTFTVDKGADMSQMNDLPIKIRAVDDAVDDDTEPYTVILTNIQEKGTDYTDSQDYPEGSPDISKEIVGTITIEKRDAETTIRDDYNEPSRDGYWVGIQNAQFSESSSQTGNDFKSDGFTVPIVLFDQKTADGSSVQENNPPTEAITVKLNVDGQDIDPAKADQDQDYYLNEDGSLTVTIDPGQWKYVKAENDIPAHWKYDANIPRNDDRLTEGDETFTVSIESVTGHESAPIPDGEKIGGITGSGVMTIVDDATLDGTGGGRLDGPALLSFGPDGKVIEPGNRAGEDSWKDGTLVNQEEGNKVDYKITLDAVAEEKIVVFIKVNDLPNDDFRIPPDNNLQLLDDATLKTLVTDYSKYGIDPEMPTGAGYYYLIIDKGQSEASFQVEILHDHDSASKAEGADNPGEVINMTITNMVGSEVRFDPDSSLNKNNEGNGDEIEDDMHGPSVHLADDHASTATSGAEMNLADMVSMDTTAAEDVTVTVRILASDGTSSYHKVMIPKGANQPDECMITMPDADYAYIQIVSSSGGESQPTLTLDFVDLTAPGSGGDHGLITLGVSATDIQEDGETSVTYTVTGTLPTDHTAGEDLSFTIKAINQSSTDNDFAAGGPGTDVRVTIPKELLNDLKDESKFTVDIKTDPVTGETSYTLTGTTKDGESIEQELSGTGKPPQARDDNSIEGDESFTSVITNITGGATIVPGYSMDEAVTTIKDNDTPSLKVEYFTDEACTKSVTSATEGDEVYVKVTLVKTLEDGSEIPLTLDNGHLTVALKGDCTAASDGNVVLENQYLVIENGSSAVTKVTLPNDYKSEDTLELSITATVDVGMSDSPLAGTITADSPLLTITDTVDGPNLLFKNDKTVGENADVCFSVTLDKALEEDATLSFRLDLADSDDTANAFVLADIASITVDDETYLVTDLTTDSTKPIYIGGDGHIHFNMSMASGSSKESFRVKLNDDSIREVDAEKLSITLINTEGGELCVDGTPFAEYEPPITSTVMVTDVMSGPTISLAPNSEGVEGGELSVQLNLTGGKLVADTEISLQLGEGVLANLVKGDTGTMKTSGEEPKEYLFTIDEHGKINLTLPEGAKGPLTLSFPMQDNATEADNENFVISLSTNVEGGEARIDCGVIDYSSSIVSETNTSLKFELDGKASSQDAKAVITLDGLPDDDASMVESLTLTISGKTYTIESDQLSVKSDKLSYKIPDDIKAGVDLNDVAVTLTFSAEALKDADKLAEAKLNANVGLQLEGKGLSIAVKDDKKDDAVTPEDAKADYDGPRFSVEAADSVMEGAAVLFTILPNAQDGFTTTEDDITLRFKLTDDAEQMENLTYSGGKDDTFQKLPNGEYSITLPKGTDLEKWNGQITADLKDADGKIANDGSLGIELTGTEGGESSLLGDGKTATVTINDAEAATAVAHGIDPALLTDGMELHQVATDEESGVSGYDGSVADKAQVILGSDAADTIIGGVGNDILVGGTGDDTITGGLGNDTFVWNNANMDGGKDVITDFALGDKLNFNDLFANPGTLEALLKPENFNESGTTYTFTDNTTGVSLSVSELQDSLQVSYQDASHTQSVKLQNVDSGDFTSLDALDDAQAAAAEILLNIIKHHQD